MEHVRGDREGDLSALAGRSWDAVVDTSGYLPRVVRASARRLAGRVDRYAFISSGAVYAATGDEDSLLTEESPVGSVEPSGSEDLASNYGALKFLCERAAEEELPGRTFAVRSGLVAGPFDPTGRFTYWVRRMAAGGEVLAPGPPDRLVQFIDVRDLAAWVVDMIETGQTGVFNAAAPPVPLSVVLEACRAESGGGANLVWVSEDFVLRHGLAPFSELPLWLPRREAGLLRMDTARAVAAGLRIRPLGETIKDTAQWSREHRDTWVAGLDPDREKQLLRSWRQSRA
jgi:2'-hydroxyisoflavone reductase